jgi:hypothetical protein
MTTITQLPDPPSTADPANFSAEADAFIAALPVLVDEINEFGAALNSLSTTSTSVSSVLIGTGTKNFTVETGKSYFVGMSLKLAFDATNWMVGEVISYNSGTGALSVNVVKKNGSGTYAAWVITLGFNGIIGNGQLAFDGGAFEFRNRLINPRGEVYQIAVAATADDTYFADQWYALTQTGTVLPSVLSDVADGYPVGVRLTQSQAIAQRFGYAQIIEAKNCKDLRGQSGTLVPRIRVSNSQAIRYAILGWTGTADTVTSDVVLDWTSASYTAGGFFLAANLSVLAVGSMTPAANTLTSLTELTASLGSAFNNIIIMVWTEGTAAQNFTLDFVYNQFEQGESATPFEFRDIDRETFLCERYFEKTFSASVAPASNAGLEGAISTTSGAALSNTTTTNYVFKTEKRSIPTIVTYNPSAAGSDWRGLNDATNIAASAENIGTKQASIAISGAPTAGRKYAIHATASARL